MDFKSKSIFLTRKTKRVETFKILTNLNSCSAGKEHSQLLGRTNEVTTDWTPRNSVHIFAVHIPRSLNFTCNIMEAGPTPGKLAFIIPNYIWIIAATFFHVFENISSKRVKARFKVCYNLVSLLTSVLDNCKASDRHISFWLHIVGYPSLLGESSFEVGEIYNHV